MWVCVNGYFTCLDNLVEITCPGNTSVYLLYNSMQNSVCDIHMCQHNVYVVHTSITYNCILYSCMYISVCAV